MGASSAFLLAAVVAVLLLLGTQTGGSCPSWSQQGRLPVLEALQVEATSEKRPQDPTTQTEPSGKGPESAAGILSYPERLPQARRMRERKRHAYSQWETHFGCTLCQLLFGKFNEMYRERSECQWQKGFGEDVDNLKNVVTAMRQLVRLRMPNPSIAQPAAAQLKWWTDNLFIAPSEMQRLHNFSLTVCPNEHIVECNDLLNSMHDASPQWWKMALYVVEKGCKARRKEKGPPFTHFGGQCPPELACNCLFGPDLVALSDEVILGSSICPVTMGQCMKEISGLLLTEQNWG